MPSVSSAILWNTDQTGVHYLWRFAGYIDSYDCVTIRSCATTDMTIAAPKGGHSQRGEKCPIAHVRSLLRVTGTPPELSTEMSRSPICSLLATNHSKVAR